RHAWRYPGMDLTGFKTRPSIGLPWWRGLTLIHPKLTVACYHSMLAHSVAWNGYEVCLNY
ncbi:MAG: hypothetical protein L7V86_23675, partial [Verrucomicrobiales bacterium]|nr:hypothetical protein [Verrucomicrobiales bacterium]